jgi:hypothetical protein
MAGILDFVKTVGRTSDTSSKAPGATLVSLFRFFIDLVERTVPVSGNPHVATITCDAPDTYETDSPYTSSLNRNAHSGFLRAVSSNQGVVSVKLSHDGSTWTLPMEELNPGEILRLDGLDIHSVQVASTSAGDQVIAFAF